MAKTYMRAPNGEVFETSNPEYHKDCEDLGHGQKGYAARAEYAKSELRKIIKPGDAVYTILRRVGASGMSRDISVCVVQNGYIRNLDALVSDACGIRMADGPGLRMRGCGMDMGFYLVYSLGCALFPQGFGTVGKNPNTKQKEVRAASKPAAARYVKAGFVFRGRNGDASGWDTDGGYSLDHKWL